MYFRKSNIGNNNYQVDFLNHTILKRTRTLIKSAIRSDHIRNRLKKINNKIKVCSRFKFFCLFCIQIQN